MRIQKQMISRLNNLLVKDKLGLNDGFLTAFRSDITHILGDYFALGSNVDIEVRHEEDGNYSVLISAKATQIKEFGTTLKQRDIF